MSRPLRIEFPGAWYHVMNRGRRGDDIFSAPEDFEEFIILLQKCTALWGIKVSAYCLMSNHYHLLVQTPLNNLSRAMRHLNGVYTQYFNRIHGCDGVLFRGRYKAILVEENSYLLELVRYIHRNPLRAGMIAEIGQYTWSSHAGYLSSAKKWNWLHKNFILEMLSPEHNSRTAAYRKFMDLEDSAEICCVFDKLKLPAIVGSDNFKDWVKGTFFEGKTHRQVPDSEQLAPDAERITTVICQYYGVDSSSLMKSKRGTSNEPRNVAIYLNRILRRDNLLTIGAVFGIHGYSSVSSAIDRIGKRLPVDKELQNRITEIKRELIYTKSHAET